MGDISFIVVREGEILYSGNDPKKMEETLTGMKYGENGYCFSRGKDSLLLSSLGNQISVITISDEKTIQALKGLL